MDDKIGKKLKNCGKRFYFLNCVAKYCKNMGCMQSLVLHLGIIPLRWGGRGRALNKPGGSGSCGRWVSDGISCSLSHTFSLSHSQLVSLSSSGLLRHLKLDVFKVWSVHLWGAPHTLNTASVQMQKWGKSEELVGQHPYQLTYMRGWQTGMTLQRTTVFEVRIFIDCCWTKTFL